MPQELVGFADKLVSIIRLLMRGFAQRMTATAGAGHVTIQQLFILEFLHSQEQPTMTDLARNFKVSTAAMTQTVERLVRDGLAARVYDPNDRRVIKVRLTSRASELIKKIEHQRRKMIIEIFGQVSADDRRQYLRILTKIKDILTTSNAKN